MCVEWCYVVASANENSSTSSSSTTGWLVGSAEHMELPRKVLKRGRPKGVEQTVIGLPAKRKCFTKPVAFCKKDPLQKNLELYIVWFMLYVKVNLKTIVLKCKNMVFQSSSAGWCGEQGRHRPGWHFDGER